MTDEKNKLISTQSNETEVETENRKQDRKKKYKRIR